MERLVFRACLDFTGFFVKNSCELFDQKVGSSQDEKS